MTSLRWKWPICSPGLLLGGGGGGGLNFVVVLELIRIFNGK